VADVGCGHGASTVHMALAYPESRFTGIDPHDRSVETARKRAADAGVADRVRFECAAANQLTGSYDLIAFFDCLHDLGDPVGALTRARTHLNDGGTVLLVEPMAGDEVADNLNPVVAAYYGSRRCCALRTRSRRGGRRSSARRRARPGCAR
jgi:cyclopropane fatty-acyl-phospholipid synthase-like methyltransferase